MAGRAHGAAKATKTATTPQGQAPFFRWLFGSIFSLLRRHGQTVVFCATFWAVTHEGSKAVIAFAGKESNANLVFNLLSNVSFVFTGSVAISGLSISLYWRERGQHRATRKRLAGRITELELQADPSRTSSKLTEEGLTRKEDK